jgi:hypothetical protein
MYSDRSQRPTPGPGTRARAVTRCLCACARRHWLHLARNRSNPSATLVEAQVGGYVRHYALDTRI